MAVLPQEMQATINRYAIGAAVIGVPGAFAAHADLGVLAFLWRKMIIELARQAGGKLDNAKAKKLALGVLSGVAKAYAGYKLANTYFAMTGAGTVPAMAINSAANAYFTRQIGHAVGEVFLSDTPTDCVPSLAFKVVRAAMDQGLGDVVTPDGGGPRLAP